MKIIFVSEANLKSKDFVINLVHNFKFTDRYILLHDAFGGTVKDTRFVTKRLSSLISESMVVNNAFSGDQREILKLQDGALTFRSDYVSDLLKNLHLFILNPIAATPEGPQLQPTEQVIQLIRNELNIEEVLVFPDNGKSHLGSERVLIDTTEDFDRLVGIYEEEAKALSRALRLRPATIVSPVNYAQ